MSVTETVRRAGPFDTDGAQTEFPFAFKVFSGSDILVTSTEDLVAETLVYETDYTVELNADQNANPGGTVVIDPALDGPTVTITSDMPATQPTTFTNPFYPIVLTNSADRAVILVQQLLETTSRAALAPLDPSGLEGYVPQLDEDGEWQLVPMAGTQGEQGEPGANVMAVGLFTAISGLTIPVGTDIIQTSGHTVKGVGIGTYVNDAAVDAAYVTAHPLSAQISANGRGFRLVTEHGVLVTQLGAIGDTASPAADTAAALEAYSGIARRVGWPESSGDYLLNETIESANVDTWSTGKKNSAEPEDYTGGAVVRPNVALDVIFDVNGQNTQFEGMRVVGESRAGFPLAGIGIKGNGCNGSNFRNNWVERCIYDGVHLGATGNNSSTIIDNNLIRSNGNYYAATFTTTLGSNIVTVAGQDLTVLDPRALYDHISLTFGDENKRIHTIASIIDATHLTVTRDIEAPEVGTGAGRIHIGSNVMIANNGDNSVIKVTNNTLQFAGGPAICNLGLYGVQTHGNTIENNGFHSTTGAAGVSSPLGTLFDGDYIEGNNTGAVGRGDFYIESAIAGIRIYPALVDSLKLHKGIIIPDFNSVNGFHARFGAIEYGRLRLHSDGNTALSLDWNFDYVLKDSSGVNDITLMLPDIDALEDPYSILESSAQPIYIWVNDMNSSTVTLDTDDGGSLINGSATKTWSGDYYLLTCTPTADGWLVTGGPSEDIVVPLPADYTGVAGAADIPGWTLIQLQAKTYHFEARLRAVTGASGSVTPSFGIHNTSATSTGGIAGRDVEMTTAEIAVGANGGMTQAAMPASRSRDVFISGQIVVTVAGTVKAQLGAAMTNLTLKGPGSELRFTPLN